MPKDNITCRGGGHNKRLRQTFFFKYPDGLTKETCSTLSVNT